MHSLWPRLMPGALTRMHSDDGVLVTIDDGPHPSSTPALLHALDACGMRAVHFMCSDHADAAPALARACTDRGDAIGSHARTHRRMGGTAADTHAELAHASERIALVTGCRPKYFRPPFGWWNPAHAEALHPLGLRLMLWSRMPEDYAPHVDAHILEDTLDRTLRAGDIVVMHDRPDNGTPAGEQIRILARVMARKGLHCIDPLAVGTEVRAW